MNIVHVPYNENGPSTVGLPPDHVALALLAVPPVFQPLRRQSFPTGAPGAHARPPRKHMEFGSEARAF